jgi:CRP-like cAMP-binding protein
MAANHFPSSLCFECVDLNLLFQIMTSLTPIFALPGEFLAREGEAPREIIFVVSGRIQLLAKALNSISRPEAAADISLRRRASVTLQRISSVFERPRNAVHSADRPPLPIPSPQPEAATATDEIKPCEVGIIEPGGLYGDAEVLLNKPHAVSARALTLIEACACPSPSTYLLFPAPPTFKP